MKKIISAILTALLIMIIPALFIGYLTIAVPNDSTSSINYSGASKRLNFQAVAKPELTSYKKDKI